MARHGQFEAPNAAGLKTLREGVAYRGAAGETLTSIATRVGIGPATMLDQCWRFNGDRIMAEMSLSPRRSDGWWLDVRWTIVNDGETPLYVIITPPGPYEDRTPLVLNHTIAEPRPAWRRSRRARSPSSRFQLAPPSLLASGTRCRRGTSLRERSSDDSASTRTLRASTGSGPSHGD